MIGLLTWLQVNYTDFNALITQLPIVGICLMIVWYFDNKNDKKDVRFQMFVREMQDDWQEYLKSQASKQEEVMRSMQEVIGKHTETLNASMASKNALINLIEREILLKHNKG